jgi:hypothetical protein
VNGEDEGEDRLSRIEGLSSVVQVRDLPAMRVAERRFVGPPAELGRAFQDLLAFVEAQGIAPAGPLIAAFPRLMEHRPGADPASLPAVEVLARIPLSRLPDEGLRPRGAAFAGAAARPGPAAGLSSVITRRVPAERAATVFWQGPMDPGDGRFRQLHLDLFAWMDAHALPRSGTAHEHAYVSGGSAEGSEWVIEIRVPVGRVEG